jgi:L-fuculose-phosphate aldolase
MMSGNRTLRQQLIRYARALHQRGWVANHDGNLSARLGANRFLSTPTATSKEDVDERNLIEVDGAGKKVAGTARPFSELNLHLTIYQERGDVNAVVHAHPPHATALACSGSRVLERPFIAEAVVSIGASIPTVPFAVPGKEAADALRPFAGDYDAVLLENHGALAWGATPEQAYLRLELVEHLARIASLAQASGGVRPLPDSAIGPLLEKRARSGLGKAADKAAARTKPVVACAPAPHAPQVSVVQPGGPSSSLVRVIREELMNVLRDGE